MITTPVRDPQDTAAPVSSAEALRRFVRGSHTTAPARPAGRHEAPQRSLGERVRAGEYVVDVDAVAAAMLDRLAAGRSLDPHRRG